jgi:DNA polymerase-3 subunit epsilon
MSFRQVILDVETTGLRVEEGHKIIEIGCVEMIDRKLTGKYFHCYLNPEREIDAGAIAVHGITKEQLQDKPFFRDIVKAFIDFIKTSELIIHNAPFDLGFLNYEGSQTEKSWRDITSYCNVIDTLKIARQLHVGQRNSLDVLCKRYGIDNSKREWHGALLDAHLLAQVYLAMTGGQGSFFDSFNQHQPVHTKTSGPSFIQETHEYQLVVIHANENELVEHKNYLESLKKQGNVLWLEDEACPSG